MRREVYKQSKQLSERLHVSMQSTEEHLPAESPASFLSSWLDYKACLDKPPVSARDLSKMQQVAQLISLKCCIVGQHAAC